MRLLLDTHLLLWAAGDLARLSQAARTLIRDPGTTPVFSVVSIWEVAIKRALARPDFRTDSRVLRRALLDNGIRNCLFSAPMPSKSRGCPFSTKTRSTAS